jgi:hypothetical protein
MPDNYTQLNPGVGGDYMDEVGVTFPQSPNVRKRPKVVITGPGDTNVDDIAAVETSTPQPNDYGLVVRPVVTCKTSNVTTVAASTTNTTLLNPNNGRIYAAIFNDSVDSVLYIKLGTDAATDSYTIQLYPFGFYELPSSYIGQVDGIWNTNTGNAQVTEII